MRKFLDALRLLTIIPLPPLRKGTPFSKKTPERPGGEVSGEGGEKLSEGALEESPGLSPGAPAYFPAVGALCGGLLFILGRGALLFWPMKTVAAILVLGWVLLTGGLHLDGLSDTMDGLGGGNTREKRLQIMGDSRIGTFGALALILALLMKYVLLEQLEDVLLFPVLVSVLSLARAFMLGAMFFFPSARPQGMGAFFKRGLRRRHILSAWAGTAGLVFLLTGAGGIFIAIGGALIAWIAAFGLTKLQGGLTGDSYGALCEVSEILLLASFTALKAFINFPFWRGLVP